MTGSSCFDHRAPAQSPVSSPLTRVTLGWTRSGTWIGVTRTGPHPDAVVTVLHQGRAQETLQKVYEAAGWAAPLAAPEPALALRAGDVIILEHTLTTGGFEAVVESLDGQTLGRAQGPTPEEALAHLRLTPIQGS